MKISLENRDWKAIVYRGVENQQCDYKSHLDWNKIGRIGRAKFARHAMALGNTAGGYIVIGVSEDEKGNPTLYTGMTPEELSSFDPSSVGQTINRYADPPVQFDIIRPEIDGKSYVILVIYPFSNLPHICTDNCENELRNGVFYIRTPDARSRVADKSSEIQWLIQRALRNQRHLLGQMLRGILYEGQLLTDNLTINQTLNLKNECRLTAKEIIGVNLFNHAIFCEIIIQPTSLQEQNTTTLSELKQTINTLVAPSIQHFPQPNMGETKIYATNGSIKRHHQTETQLNFYQEFFLNGLHYNLVFLSPEHTPINYSTLRYLIANATLISEQIYTELNYSDAILNISINIINSENSTLINLPFSKSSLQEFSCFIPEIQVQRRRSVADLNSGATAELTIKLLNEISERFNHIVNDQESLREKEILKQEISCNFFPLTP